MFAMVSLTAVLPGKALVMVSGAKELPGRRSAGSGFSSQSLKPRDMQQVAGVPS